MVVFIEFEAKDTVIHRLNPVAKLVWFGSIVVLLTLYLEPQPLLIVFLLEVLVGTLAKVPWRKLLARAWWAFLLSIFGGYTYSIWINKPSQFWRIPPELGCKTILVITPEGTPLMGYTAITVGGLLWGTAMTLRVFIGVIAASILTFITPVSDLAMIWAKFLPYKLSFICTTGVRFYPVMIEKIQEIMTAAKSRGWDMSSKNPVKRIRAVFPIVIPASREAMLLADKMALAMEAKAFGVRKPTVLKTIEFTPSDILFIVFSISFTIMMFLMWWFYGFGML
ncbi:MAG: hypothetical protein DRJ49_05920 [Thermoprotei archaeon]|nr:MAG: hypothetical protein DRJ49_05920 [Thermoprotei archaeon]